MPKVSESYKEDRKNNILNSAMVCFAEKGYAQATVDDIVNESGMSKGAVYHYFKSKDDIYLTLLDRALERTFNRLNTMFRDGLSASHKIKKLFKVYQSIDYKDTKDMNKRSVQLEFWVNAFRNDELSKRLFPHKAKAINFIATILEEGKRTGEFRTDLDPMLTAESFWTFTDGLFLHVLVDKENYPFEAMYVQFEKMFMNHLITKS